MMQKSAVLLALGFALVGCRTGKSPSGDALLPVCVEGNSSAKCSSLDSREGRASDLAQLRTRVTKIFTDNCAACHANGNRQGGFGDVLNLELLTKGDSKYVKIGLPETSLLYTRMTDANQPMPTKGLLDKESIDLVRQWIAAEGKASGEARERVKMSSVFKTIRDDFDRQQNRLELRYIHFVNLWNSGVSEAEIQRHREALSKLLNMLSTSPRIQKPVAIDGKGLIFRLDLQDYEMHLPHGLRPPRKNDAKIGRWKEVFEARRPARDTAAEDAFFVARFQVVPPEYKTTGACDKNKLIRPYQCSTDLLWMKSVMTLNNANPLAGDPIGEEKVLLDYIANSGTEVSILQNETDDFVVLPNITGTTFRAGSTAVGIVSKEGVVSKGPAVPLPPVVKVKDPTRPANATTNPIAYSQEHTPIPLMRGDWFIHEVLGNYKQRVYYHLAGIPDDTGVLDIALGIDDEGALLRDNAADQSNGIKLEPIIMRSGFTDSGVSQNHRILERIETQQFPEKALWRSYEFEKADEGKNKYQHALKYPFGPVLFDNKDETVLGYECINMFTNPNNVFKDENGNVLVDWARKYWTQTPINFDYIRPNKKADPSKLSPEDRAIYDRFWNGDTKLAVANSIECDETKNGVNVREADKTFDFHGFEYQFMRPNGLQGFATVATNAFITDFKIPSDEAFKTTRAVFATSDSGQKIVTQPLSCLSCHSRGLIDKRDVVREYVKKNQGTGGFTQEQVSKAERIYVPQDKFTQRLEKDNATIQAAITATGAQLTEEEPNVQAYKRFVSRVKLEVLAADVGVRPENLTKLIAAAKGTSDTNLYSDLVALTAGNGDVLRETTEKHLPRLIELASIAGYFE